MVKTVLPMQGAQVQSLVRELRSCMPFGEAKKKKKKKTQTKTKTNKQKNLQKMLRTLYIPGLTSPHLHKMNPRDEAEINCVVSVPVFY